MCVCMCVCVHVCVYVFVCVCMYVYVCIALVLSSIQRILAFEAAEAEKDRTCGQYRLKNIHYVSELKKLAKQLRQKVCLLCLCVCVCVTHTSLVLLFVCQ